MKTDEGGFLWVRFRRQARERRDITLEINGRFPAAKTNYDLVIEICIRVESRSHAPGVWANLRASVSFA